MSSTPIPKEYRLESYDYALPETLIAQTPLEERDRARLMVVHRKTERIEHRVFSDLPDYLRPDDALVINDTKVIAAKLVGRKQPSGGRIEALVLRPGEKAGLWEALVRGSAGAGQRITFGPLLQATVRAEKGGGLKVLEFSGNGSIETLLEGSGVPPLPPYIRREPVSEDRERYQTVYASARGSVAAPTAGMHFTESLLDEIRSLGVVVVRVTLHIGRGTFKPVRCSDVRDHPMEPEWYAVGAAAAAQLQQTRRRGGRIIAVGTTSTRVLESAPYAIENPGPLSGWTGLYVRPGHVFKNTDALVTNFHVPRSTLLMLVSVFGGMEQIRRAYAAAVEARYRFLSFGDAMLIL